MPAALTTAAGSRHPPGASRTPRGVNFSVFSREATAVELVLYAGADAPVPFQVVRLDPDVNRTYFEWHVEVLGLPEGTHYTWRVDGPHDPASGARCDPGKELVDPWARAVTDAMWDREAARRPEPAPHRSIRALLPSAEPYDWEGDAPLGHRLRDTIIYEVHVGGFTRHPSSGVRRPGSFAGLIEKIPYLQSLGITDVELLPVMAFDEQDMPPASLAAGLRNYWGYSPHSFWAPHPGYCSAPASGTQVREFRDMVKALHRARIGVILDVVFNHTAEAGADGPVVNFKGLSNATAYLLDPSDRSRYLDYTGCGNTLNCNHPIMTAFVRDCLEYWVREMHVDGFRFDLASVLTRGEDGAPVANAPVVWAIELSDALAHTRLIAEAWDAGGLYQVGAFPGMRWAEWNGRYRDAVRRFVRGDPGMAGEIATRLAGSSDLYRAQGKHPINGINFVTSHDGYTLHDLVAYERKHNHANGWHNRDGTDDNLSWNCGIEGDTADPVVLALRRRQARNCIAILMLSQGVPMLLAGDEVLRTQHGNNNAYCQDNETSWFDWSLLEREADMLRFVRAAIALRRRHAGLRRERFLTGEAEGGGAPDVAWHGQRLGQPPWDDAEARFLAFTLAPCEAGEPPLHVLLNMHDAALGFALPDCGRLQWHVAIDTFRRPPDDAVEPARQRPHPAPTYEAGPRSVVVLEARAPGAVVGPAVPAMT